MDDERWNQNSKLCFAKDKKWTEEQSYEMLTKFMKEDKINCFNDITSLFTYVHNSKYHWMSQNHVICWYPKYLRWLNIVFMLTSSVIKIEV